MTITEFATLELATSVTLTLASVRQFFRKTASRQAAWSGHPILFFQDTRLPAVLYLVSGWKDISAHQAWIASDENQSLLKEAEIFMTVKGLAHLDIDFQSMPVNAGILCFIATRNALGEGLEGPIGAPVAWERSGMQLDGDESVKYWLKIYDNCGDEEQDHEGFVRAAAELESRRPPGSEGWHIASAIQLYESDPL